MSIARNRHRQGRILAWGINLAGILTFVLILYLGGAEAWRQILLGDLRYVAAALAATLLWNLVAAYRWFLIVDAVTEGQPGCPYRTYFTYHMIGMVTGQVVPIGVGLVGARPLALSLSRTVSLRRAALSVVLDKFFDLILALLLVVPIALYLVGWIPLPAAMGLIGAAVLSGTILIGWQYERGMRWLGGIGVRLSYPLARVPVVGRRLVSRLPQQLERLANESFVSNGRAVGLFALTLVLYTLLSARLVFIALALRLQIPWYLLAMGVAVTQLTLIFSVTPGSLGFLEGGWGAVFSLGGQTLEAFTVFVIGRRAYVWIFTLVCALLAFAWIRESPARLFRAVLSASREPNGAEAQNISPNVVVR